MAIGQNGLSGTTTETSENGGLSQMAEVRTNPYSSIREKILDFLVKIYDNSLVQYITY